MKKRILALMLTLVLSLSLIPINNVSAAVETTSTVQNYSDWALNDLMVGDTYGIYPLNWYNNDMTTPITQAQFRTLIAGVRIKILGTDCVTNNTNPSIKLGSTLTVEKALTTFYDLLASYEFSTDIGLKGKTAVEYMTENGVYTGKNGELMLKETCTVEQACVFATRLITCVYDKLDAASKGFLWVAKSGGNTVYMLGSIHFASTDIYPFSKDILEAYQSSDSLVLEIDLSDTEGPYKLAALAVYNDGTTLKDHVSAETYQKVMTLATEYGYPESVVSMLKPWYLYLTFSGLTYTESGTTEDAVQAANLGIDMNLMTNAYVNGKTILEIEGYENQGKMLDSFSDELEEYLLNSTIDEINNINAGAESASAEDLTLMLDLWKTGDVETFKEYNSFENEYATLYADEDSSTELELMKEFQEKLLTNRDLGMAAYIDNLLKSEGSSTYFVVVGSLHYISDYSVLDILKSKGYEITQIK